MLNSTYIVRPQYGHTLAPSNTSSVAPSSSPSMVSSGLNLMFSRYDIYSLTSNMAGESARPYLRYPFSVFFPSSHFRYEYIISNIFSILSLSESSPISPFSRYDISKIYIVAVAEAGNVLFLKVIIDIISATLLSSSETLSSKRSISSVRSTHTIRSL